MQCLPLELIGERLDVDQALHVDLAIEALDPRLPGKVGGRGRGMSEVVTCKAGRGASTAVGTLRFEKT